MGTEDRGAASANYGDSYYMIAHMNAQHAGNPPNRVQSSSRKKRTNRDS
jgi:hypothetical protein